MDFSRRAKLPLPVRRVVQEIMRHVVIASLLFVATYSAYDTFKHFFLGPGRHLDITTAFGFRPIRILPL